MSEAVKEEAKPEDATPSSWMKSSFLPYVVIPAKAGIQDFQRLPGSRFRGSDLGRRFFRILLGSERNLSFVALSRLDPIIYGKSLSLWLRRIL